MFLAEQLAHWKHGAGMSYDIIHMPRPQSLDHGVFLLMAEGGFSA